MPREDLKAMEPETAKPMAEGEVERLDWGAYRKKCAKHLEELDAEGEVPNVLFDEADE